MTFKLLTCESHKFQFFSKSKNWNLEDHGQYKRHTSLRQARVLFIENKNIASPLAH